MKKMAALVLALAALAILAACGASSEASPVEEEEVVTEEGEIVSEAEGDPTLEESATSPPEGYTPLPEDPIEEDEEDETAQTESANSEPAETKVIVRDEGEPNQESALILTLPADWNYVILTEEEILERDDGTRYGVVFYPAADAEKVTFTLTARTLPCEAAGAEQTDWMRSDGSTVEVFTEAIDRDVCVDAVLPDLVTWDWDLESVGLQSVVLHGQLPEQLWEAYQEDIFAVLDTVLFTNVLPEEEEPPET